MLKFKFVEKLFKDTLKPNNNIKSSKYYNNNIGVNSARELSEYVPH